MPKQAVIAAVRLALLEDAPHGDITTDLLVGADSVSKADIVFKEEGIVAGMEVARQVFCLIDENAEFTNFKLEGETAAPNEKVATVYGRTRALLTSERTALNFIQRMSGIATTTSRYVNAVRGKAIIIDTRKTVPGLRAFDKYAVLVGGGQNHRFGLSDGVLIKDNHIANLSKEGKSMVDIVSIAKAGTPHTIRIEVEADTEELAVEAAEAGVDAILLDNMPPELVKRIVGKIGGKCITEASGNITLDNVSDMADTGVNLISIGALTHSVRSLDISLEIRP